MADQMSNPIMSAAGAQEFANLKVGAPEDRANNLLRNVGSNIDLQMLYNQQKQQQGQFGPAPAPPLTLNFENAQPGGGPFIQQLPGQVQQTMSPMVQPTPSPTSMMAGFGQQQNQAPNMGLPNVGQAQDVPTSQVQQSMGLYQQLQSPNSPMGAFGSVTPNFGPMGPAQVPQQPSPQNRMQNMDQGLFQQVSPVPSESLVPAQSNSPVPFAQQAQVLPAQQQNLDLGIFQQHQAQTEPISPNGLTEQIPAPNHQNLGFGIFQHPQAQAEKPMVPNGLMEQVPAQNQPNMSPFQAQTSAAPTISQSPGQGLDFTLLTTSAPKLGISFPRSISSISVSEPGSVLEPGPAISKDSSQVAIQILKGNSERVEEALDGNSNRNDSPDNGLQLNPIPIPKEGQTRPEEPKQEEEVEHQENSGEEGKSQLIVESTAANSNASQMPQKRGSSFFRRNKASSAPASPSGKTSSSPGQTQQDNKFMGEGQTFKGKLIGVLEVQEARGDRMCQDALQELKTAIKASGEHKQRVIIQVAVDGLKIRDEKTGDCLYHHPVHKISFIAQDVADNRAFGYIYGSPENGHRFFGIKTEKAAGQVVVAMRDLFQVVFELKKKQIEDAKTNISDVLVQKSKEQPQQQTQHQQKAGASYPDGVAAAIPVESPGGALTDLLGLESELANIQREQQQQQPLFKNPPPLGNLDSAPQQQQQQPQQDSKDLFGSAPFLPPPPSKGNRQLQMQQQQFMQQQLLQQQLQQQQLQQFNMGAAAGNNPLADIQDIVVTASDKYEYISTAFDNISKPPVAVPHQNSSFESNPIPTETVVPQTPNQHNNNFGSLSNNSSSAAAPRQQLFTDLDPLGTGKTKPFVDRREFFSDVKTLPKLTGSQSKTN